MAVPEQTPYIEHIGNGATTSFALGFQCESKDHLIVLVDEIEPPIETWSLIDENAVFTTAPASGKKIVLQRNTAMSRTTNYQSYNNSFRPETINGDLDRVWWKIQELGVRDWLLDLKIQKFRDDVNLTALEETLEQAKEIRDNTADSVIEVQSNVEQSQTLLANTTAQANAATSSATSANSSKDLAKQYADNIDASLTAIAGGHKAYATLAAALANTSTFPQNSIVEITNDGANNGAYQWNGADLTKSAYDPFNKSKQYTDSELESIGKESLTELARTTDFVAFDEYALLNDSYKSILLDSLNNAIEAIINNEKYFFLPLNLVSLKVGDVAVEPDGLLTANQKNIVRNINESYSIISSQDEFSLANLPAYVICDSNFNVILDSDTYNNLLLEFETQKSKVNDLDGRVEALENKTPINNQFIPTFNNNKIIVQNINDFSEKVIDDVGNVDFLTQFESNEIIWKTDLNADTDGMMYATAPEFKQHPVSPRKTIAVWGHSFTENGPFIRALEAETGLKVYGFGKSATSSTAISALQGGKPLKVNVVGNTIPASGSVVLTPYIPRLLTTTSKTMDCRIVGIDGVLSRTDESGFIFTRSNAGTAKSVSGLQEIYFYPKTTVSATAVPQGTLYEKHDECINVLWIGRNNINEPAVVMSDLAKMIAHLKTKSKRIVICSDFPSTSEVTGTVIAGWVSTMNALYKSTYPQFYCEIDGIDVLQNLQSHASTSQDFIDVSNGVPPSSLLADNLHPNANGAAINAAFIKNFMQLKGWI